MILDCLHVYEDSPMGRMAADSFISENVKAICVGEALVGIGTKKILFHTPLTLEIMPWVSENVLTRLAP